MLSSEPYIQLDEELHAKNLACRSRVYRYNATGEGLDELLPVKGKNVTVIAPFFCDYGTNITIGDNVFINFNCVFLDCGAITIGSNVLIGPSVQLYAATHPVDYLERQKHEMTKPIVIGSNVWIGGGAVVCPGVTIGDRSVVAAGSVVVHDVPADTLVAGNPAVFKRALNNA